MKAMPLVASMLGNKLRGKVVIGSSDTAYTNGDTIFLPPLPVDDEGVLYPLVSGFIDHDAAHIRHTDLGVLKGKRLPPVEKHLWNAIEDWGGSMRSSNAIRDVESILSGSYGISS